MAVVFVVVQAAVDGPRRLRRFMLAGARVARPGARRDRRGAPTMRSTTDSDALAADRTPIRTGSRCASSPCCCSRCTAQSPAPALDARRVRRDARRADRGDRAHHSRSGAVAAAIALALFLFRGGTLTLGRKFAAAGVIALALLVPPGASGSARRRSSSTRRTSRSRGERTPGRCSASSSRSVRSPGRRLCVHPRVEPLRAARGGGTATWRTTSCSRSSASRRRRLRAVLRLHRVAVAQALARGIGSARRDGGARSSRRSRATS